MRIASSKDQSEMQDPTKQYPQPRFPKQTLSHPGLTRDMDPNPITARRPTKGSGASRVAKRWLPGPIQV